MVCRWGGPALVGQPPPESRRRADPGLQPGDSSGRFEKGGLRRSPFGVEAMAELVGGITGCSGGRGGTMHLFDPTVDTTLQLI